MTDLIIKYWWEASDLINADYIVTSGLDLDHPLVGCWNSPEELIKAGKAAGFNVILEEL